jgi:hypothetical protein
VYKNHAGSETRSGFEMSFKVGSESDKIISDLQNIVCKKLQAKYCMQKLQKKKYE